MIANIKYAYTQPSGHKKKTRIVCNVDLMGEDGVNTVVERLKMVGNEVLEVEYDET